LRDGLRRDVLSPASRFFSDRVRQRLDLALRARRCVQASGGRCIPRARRQAEVVRLVLVQVFRLQVRRGPAAVLVGPLAGPASVTFRAA
jgi:hypothetical protein